MSPYRDSLEPAAKIRYLDKLKLIRNVDPYEINGKDCSAKPEDFPGVTLIDILNYLVFTKSAYTQQEFRAFKNLESYKLYYSGWLKDLSLLSGATTSHTEEVTAGTSGAHSLLAEGVPDPNIEETHQENFVQLTVNEASTAARRPRRNLDMNNAVGTIFCIILSSLLCRMCHLLCRKP